MDLFDLYGLREVGGLLQLCVLIKHLCLSDIWLRANLRVDIKKKDYLAWLVLMNEHQKDTCLVQFAICV